MEDASLTDRGAHSSPVNLFTQRICHAEGAPLVLDDWATLQPNDRVCVRQDDKSVSHGRVDIVAADAAIFWIWLDGGQGRVALHREDNVGVWFADDCP